MKLISATVKNFRIHKEISVKFAPDLTLIGGPNESGKSTLAEAIHCGLFLKSKVTGEAYESMLSSRDNANPEITIVFSTDGKEYEVVKKYAKTSGTTLLREIGGSSWNGDEAEERLNNLLGVEDAGGGRGIMDRVKKQWAHLWVWQGQSGNNPKEDANSQYDNLLKRLENSGGAVALQSGLDASVANQFSEASKKLFTSTDKVKSGSELQRVMLDEAEAQEKVDNMRNRLESLRETISDYEKAIRSIESTDNEIVEAKEELLKVCETLEKINALKEELKDKENVATYHTEFFKRLCEKNGEIKKYQDNIQQLEASLQPKLDEVGQTEKKLATKKEELETANKDFERQDEDISRLRLELDFYDVCVRLFEKNSQLDQLKDKSRQIQSLQKDREELKTLLDQYVRIDDALIRELRKKEVSCREAEIALEGIATRLEVVKADAPLTVGDTVRKGGESETITEATEINFGDRLKLKITPGGSLDLQAKREEARSLRREFDTDLRRWGVADLEEAQEISVKRQTTQSKIDSLDSQLKSLEADKIGGLLKACEDEVATMATEMNRLRSMTDGVESPETLADTKTRQEAVKESLDTRNRNRVTTDAQRKLINKEVSSLSDQVEKLRQGIDEKRHELTGQKALLKQLVEEFGDETKREKDLLEAEDKQKTSTKEVNKLKEALEELQPDICENEKKRLEKALENLKERRKDAEITKATTEKELRSEGNEDPVAALELAEARLEDLQEKKKVLELKGKSIKLLDSLFTEEQQQLAEQFTRPLADRISSYLRYLFGVGATARIILENNKVSGIELVRKTKEHENIGFDALSGGAKEQVAGAVRLAIAEILARDYEGSLPVVFDDAFAYSDPERVKKLAGLLEQAASNGLQIILLSCNPSDFATLATERITLG